MAAAAADPVSSRFQHLLQPIRDLSKVWKINLSEELEGYMDELSQLMVTNPDDPTSQMNFAEAALLIQGSTNVYSRKVEMLHQLVYQALEMLSSEKSKDGSKKSRTIQSGLWAPIPDTDELLTIDHLIKEGRNILLDPTAPESRQATQRRVPLFLMPRDGTDRRKQEFRISSCTVHHSGAFLLQESDARLLDQLMGSEELQRETLREPLVPAPPQDLQDWDAEKQALLTQMEDPPTAPDPAPDEPADEVAPGTPMGAEVTPGRFKSPFGQMALSAKKGLLAEDDPWALLDENKNLGTDIPLKVGKTVRRMGEKRLKLTVSELPDIGSVEGLSDKELWKSTTSAASAAPVLTAGHPVESLFLAVAAGQQKRGTAFETTRAGFSAAWLEFEDLFKQIETKRKLFKLTQRVKQIGATTPHGSDDEGSDGEGPRGTPMKAATPMTARGNMTPLQDYSEEHEKHEKQRQEVIRLENLIQDAQGKYENTIRQHLQALQKDGSSTDNRFPELYANVRRWQDQLEPVLKEFESRPEFDIHEYSQKFLDKISSLHGQEPEEDLTGKIIKFSRLVHGQPRWETCRRFLTCLILTNIGNTDIVVDTEGQRLNDWGIKLLKAKKHWISLDDEHSEPQKPPAKRKESLPLPPAGKDEERRDDVPGKRQRKAKAVAGIR